MEREFDAYKLTRCMCPSKYNCFWDTARYLWKKSAFYHTPLHSTPPLGGSRRNIGTPFGMGKLEWCRYPMVKRFRRYLYSFWRNSGTWRTDRRTDGRTPGDGNSRAMHSIARQKCWHDRTWLTTYTLAMCVYNKIVCRYKPELQVVVVANALDVGWKSSCSRCP